MNTVKVETAQEMLAAVEQALPVDVAVFAAAVADWRVEQAEREQDQEGGRAGRRSLALIENPDILATVAHRNAHGRASSSALRPRPSTSSSNAKAKLARKGCDWIVANDVSPQTGVMGGDRNTVHLVTAQGVESWPPQSKEEVARALVERIADALAGADAVSMQVQIMRLPHARRPAASGLSERTRGRPRPDRRGAGRCADRDRARWPRPDPDRHRHRAAAGVRGPDAAALRARARHGVTVLNSPGTIDADYRGEMQVILVNFGTEPFVVTRGMRIAQLVIAPIQQVKLVESTSLDTTSRASGGFGSTGIGTKIVDNSH